MGVWTENKLDIKEARDENAVEHSFKDATVGWGLARLDELEQRFGITSPPLVARALGISAPLAMRLVKIRKDSRGERS